MLGCRRPPAALILATTLGASYPVALLADQPAPRPPPDEPSVQVEPAPAQAPAPSPPPPSVAIQSAPLSPAAPSLPPTNAGDRTPSPGPGNPSAPTAPTSPPRAARFGEAGEFVLSGALQASFGHTGSAGGSSTSFTVQPAFDYFLSPSFSVGASALVGYTDNGPTTFNNGASTTGTFVAAGDTVVNLGLSGAIGFNAWLGDRVSFWPRLSLELTQRRQTTSPPTALPSGVSVTAAPDIQTIVLVDLYVPFLFHVAQHLFVGFGPDLFRDLHNSFDGTSNKQTFIGAASTVGGWF